MCVFVFVFVCVCVCLCVFVSVSVFVFVCLFVSRLVGRLLVVVSCFLFVVS